MRSVIPNLYFFDFKFRSPKRVSSIQIDGRLDDWNPQLLVPDLMYLRSTKPFADVYFTWDDDNLYIGLRVTDKRNPVDTDPARFWRRDFMEVWLDLRNDKTQRRYTEHCHHFAFLAKGRKGNPELATASEWAQPGGPIQETIIDYKEIEIASVIERGAYSIEARIPGSVIPTYDPIKYPIIGFNYHIGDTDGRAQWWSCGPDFPRHRDPSTWGAVELIR